MVWRGGECNNLYYGAVGPVDCGRKGTGGGVIEFAEEGIVGGEETGVGRAIS